VPRREYFLFYFIPFHFIYFIYVASIARNGWVHLPVEQKEGQITCHSHSNSKPVEFQKTVAG